MLQSKFPTKRQSIVPPLRTAHNWQAGQKLQFIDTPDGILVKSDPVSFEQTPIDQVAGCLRYKGKTKSIAEMNKAIAKGAMEQSKTGLFTTENLTSPSPIQTSRQPTL
jgi:bifunctional DNA-binding transcriptional regulator/antitoxin component of YhaV-PrlF toxin-antitoxin module